MNSPPDADDQLEADVYSNLPSHNDSPTGTVTRRNRSSLKSKHSETEQRRRSKINERFQSLMDIIPQNDQKRDKASFLLEVIEYIHFLQEKVQMYEEESHQMWYQAPTKLTPWKNNHEPVVEVSDHSQMVKSFSSNDDEVAAAVAPPSGFLSDMQDCLDPYVDLAASSKILESAVSSYVPTESLPQFVQHDFWQPKPWCESSNCNTNELLNSMDEKTSDSLSNVCSQRVLHSLTEALESSGVDMSETVISVQLNLRKRADREYPVTGFATEDNCNGIVDEQGDSPTETRDLDHSEKRIRR